MLKTFNEEGSDYINAVFVSVGLLYTIKRSFPIAHYTLYLQLDTVSDLHRWKGIDSDPDAPL